MLNAHDPDTLEQIEVKIRKEKIGEAPLSIEAAIEVEKQKLIDEQQNIAKELEEQQKKIIAARANSKALEIEIEKTKKDIDATKKKIDGHKTW